MMKINLYQPNIFLKTTTATIFAIVVYLFSWGVASAASLYLSPSTGVYSSNTTFTAKVMVNTGGQPINAADGTLSFNPNELSVVSVNRSSSIFNLWVAEPAFSNSAGTISFSGGLPSGYSGQTGTIMTIVFRAKGSGTAKVNFSKGSVLANDGRGTNILTSMKGGTFTLQAATEAPEPEVIEYVAPANTPAAPKIMSSTHPDPSQWYSINKAELSWSLPSDVVSVRTLLNENPTSVPTKVYEDPIRSISLDELDEGVSYFHLQFRNNEGWGRVTHYRLAVDTLNPSKITITQLDENDLSNPNQILKVEVEDETSVVNDFKVKVDTNEPFDYHDELGSSTIPLPTLEPGYHTVIIEAFDEAGNSIVGTHSFTLQSFDRPVFIDPPTEINDQVIPVIKGKTRPNSQLEVTIYKLGSEPTVYQIDSDEAGDFVFIPEGSLSNGVYEIYAVATDQYGAKSDVSETIRIAVQQPGYLRIGSLIVSVLSVIIPLVVLVLLLIAGIWYLVAFARRFRKRVRMEAHEALEMLRIEFTELQRTLREQESSMQESRKTKKLTKSEASMIEAMDRALQSSQQKVEKEIGDITELARRRNK